MLDITCKMTETEKGIFEKYKNTFPFQIVAFARELGIKIYVNDDFSEDISGMITQKEGKYLIYVNEKHNAARKRFTIAHELGHFFNDRDYLDRKGEISDVSKQHILFRQADMSEDKEMRKRDVMANKFAAEILMPENIFIEKWQSLPSIQAVSKFFNVSIEAVRIRATNLLGEIV